MSFWKISVDTANEFYTWGWRASMFGAAITFLALFFCIGAHAFATMNLNYKWALLMRKQALHERAGKLEVRAAGPGERGRRSKSRTGAP